MTGARLRAGPLAEPVFDEARMFERRGAETGAPLPRGAAVLPGRITRRMR